MTQPPPHDPFAHPPVPSAGPPLPAPHPATAGYAGPPPPVPSAPWGPLAGWGTRVVASLIDSLIQLVGAIPYVVGLVLVVVGAPKPRYDSTTTVLSAPSADSGSTALVVFGAVLAGLGFLLALGLQIWNRSFKQGRTGQSIGKKVMGIRLVDEYSGQPIGAGMAFVRELAHALDGAVYIGYLWPLWDDKRQTFADKILSTVVVEVPRRPAMHG